MQSLLNGCTEEQKEAITHTTGPLLIIAGPGAGKTEVIVRRTANLVLNAGVNPHNILVTTFTNKATDELYDRLWKYLDRDSQEITISTIHSFCQRLLSEHPEAHPWGKSFEVLADIDQYLFVYARLKDLGLSKFPKGWQGEFLSDVVGFLSLCTEELVNADSLAERAEKDGAGLLGLKGKNKEGAEEYIAVAEAYGKYLDLLYEEKLLDFAMLQKVCYEMLSNNAQVKSEVSKRYQYILVDEYQDTNRLQVSILKLIAAPDNNLCAVGDDDQSIYRFRGATPSSFIKFKMDFPGAKEVPLTINFRSTEEIVKATSSLIEHNNPERMQKDLRSGRSGDAHPPILIKAETCAEEADKVVKFIIKAKENGLIGSYGDVALLFRSVKHHAEDYLAALEKHDIPLIVKGEGGFLGREDIISVRDLITFCGWKQKWNPECLQGKLLLLEPDTIEAIKKCAEAPEEWLEKRTLEKMGIKNHQDRKVLQDLAETRVRLQSGEIKSILDLFYELLSSTGYFTRCCKSCANDSKADGALLNLGVFSGLIGSFQRLVRSQNSYRFGEYLRSLPPRMLDEARPEQITEAIKIMTVHQAKGLEFPVVVIGSALNGRFPGRFHPQKYPIPKQLKLSEEKDDEVENLRDQRRLFYVAATRAENLLIVGAPEKVAKRGSGMSRFITEIGEKTFVGNSCLESRLPHFGRREKEHAPKSQRISFSAIQSYLLCPFLYRLLNDCEFEVAQAHWFQLGHNLHHALELLHRQAQAGSQITLGKAAEIFESSWRSNPYWSPEREKTLKETGLRYLTSYCQNHSERFQRILWVEEPIEFRFSEEFVITGRIDLACQWQDGIEVVDFKARTKKGKEILHPDFQTYTYALACENENGKKAKVNRLIIHYLAEKPGNDIEELMWDREIGDNALERLQRALEGIKGGRFDPSPGPSCRFCDFHNLCPASKSEGNPMTQSEDEPGIGATFRTLKR